MGNLKAFHLSFCATVMTAAPLTKAALSVAD
jgi:hypothetical protein